MFDFTTLVAGGGGGHVFIVKQFCLNCIAIDYLGMKLEKKTSIPFIEIKKVGGGGGREGK